MADTTAGYTLHFDFINNWEQAKQIIELAHDNGAGILNVVPPSHVWKYPESQKVLNKIFQLTRQLHMRVILSRIDACPISADDPNRANFLYAQILTRPGTLPTGGHTPQYFSETVGLRSYEIWMKEETEFYSKNYSSEDNLAGFSVGLFDEPFVSQRGSLLCYDFITKSYEIGQYTPSCLRWWQAWLKNNYHSIESVNARYNTHFQSFSSIPMPKNETDKRFGEPKLAYRDMVSSVNDWVVTQYTECRNIWHKYSKRQTPFILQLSGYLPEKFSLGRPALAMLDIYSWMQAADALGLSLYTNVLYQDWGHASDKAMVNAMYLGVMQNKHIFVMEGGNENDGAVFIPEELNFYSDTARVLKPESYIYEFIKTPFYICFKHREGYILDCSGKINNTALAAVKAALENAKTEATMAGEIYVYDDPQSLSLDNDDLDTQKQLQNIALENTLVYVPRESIALLPQASTLLVIQENLKEDIARQLSIKDIKVISARDWIKMTDNK
jgi:hypothetical protein